MRLVLLRNSFHHASDELLCIFLIQWLEKLQYPDFLPIHVQWNIYVWRRL